MPSSEELRVPTIEIENSFKIFSLPKTNNISGQSCKSFNPTWKMFGFFCYEFNWERL